MLRALMPRQLSRESGTECATFMLSLLTAIHFERFRARSQGWRGIRPCMTEGWGWTCRVAGSASVLGLVFQEEHPVATASGEAIEGLFSLHVFPPASSPLLDSFPLEALRHSLDDGYGERIRTLEAGGTFRDAFACGTLRVTLAADGQGLGLTLEAMARQRVMALDGIGTGDASGWQWIVPPGGWEANLPAFRLLLPLFGTLAASAATLLERVPKVTLAQQQQPCRGYTALGEMRVVPATTDTLLRMEAGFGHVQSAGACKTLHGLPLASRLQPAEQACKPVLHLLTGFLGSGKTTFLREWLEYLHGRDRFTGVLQNEFGAVGLDALLLRDSAMVEALDEGCVCCSLADALRPGLLRLMEALPARECILETTGLANPANVLQSLGELADLVVPGLVVTVVDAAALGGTAGACEAESALFRAQIAAAHVLILNKLDLVPEASHPELRRRLGAINPDALVLESLWGRIPFAELDLCLDGHDLEPPPPSTPLLPRMADLRAGVQHDVRRTVTHADEGFSSALWRLDGPLSREDVARLVAESGAYRVKGVVELAGEGQHIVQYVAGRLELEPVSGQPLDATFVVVIGKDVAKQSPLRSAVTSCNN